MTQSNEFSGAKWWKFDFHTHTPASSDFMQSCSNEDRNSITPELWLTKFINEGINCVAITDHNSGVWIDKLKGANDRLEKKIHLFPGVEISVHGGVHILAIFGPEKTTSDIDTNPHATIMVSNGNTINPCFVDRCLSFCTVSFGHCIVCTSSIYDF
jgi:hypothetical protein